MALLEIIEGPGAGSTFPIDGPVEVGREPGVDVLLEDAEVSRRHARLSPEAGGIAVEDLGSRNGTYVNGQPVQGRRPLRAGDELRVGVTVLALQGDRQASGVLPTPQITQVGAQVLQPVAREELPPVPAEPATPGFLVDESEPGYIPGGRAGGLAPFGGGGVLGNAPAAPTQDIEEGEQYARVAALRDPRVKPQTKLAAGGFLLIAAIAVIVYFGVTA